MEKTQKHFSLSFKGYSMYPFLKPGDRLIVRRVSPESLQIGDIVLVPDLEKKFIAHRLVKMLSPERAILKGDSLLELDPAPVKLSTLSGKVVAIVRKGRIITVSTGLRSRLKKVYAFLSLNGLTLGAIRIKGKNLLLRLFPLDESKRNNNEFRFIIETLCNRKYQKNPDIDWIKIKEIASEEGVIGILYINLKEAGIPESVLGSFRDYYLSIAARNIININALEKLESALGSARIEVMTLKGASLLNNIYPDIGMRPMGDLDLMVRPDKRGRFVKILYDLGYQKDPLLPHIFNKDRVVIDIHTHALNIDRIASRAALFPAGMEPIWSKSIPWREDYQWLRRPDDADNILLLSQHLMKHSFSKLIWLVDILRLIMNNDPMLLSDLLKRADYLRQGKSLSYTLYLLNRIFEHKLSMWSGHEYLFQGLSRLERGILGARANGQSIDLMGPLMAIFCVQGLRNRVALGWESLFPKNEMVKQKSTYAGRYYKIVAPILRRFRLILGYIIRE